MVEVATPKVAFVTGASRGIGEAIVRRFAADGIAVGFTYLSEDDSARHVAKDIEAAGGRALAIQADSSDEEAVRNAIARTAEQFGRLDIVVANAGIVVGGMIGDVSVADFDRIVAVNFRGTFLTIREAVPHLSNGGRIITIGSAPAIRTGFQGVSVYTATKAAVATLVRGAALDLAPHGITVNNIAAGPIATDMNEGNAEWLTPKIPLGRMGEAADVVGMVAYLVGDEAAFVTGSNLVIDGGFIA